MLASLVSSQWRAIGRRIDLTTNNLNSLEMKHSKNNDRCWEEVMQKWMDGGNAKAYETSWEGLYKILKDIGKPKIAADLKTAVESAF